MAKQLRKAFRLDEKQDAELKRQVAEMGLSESEFIRLLITQKPKDYPEIRLLLRRLISEVNRIGVNINEITHNNNSSFYIDEDKQRLFAYMEKLNRTLDGAVKNIGGY